MQQGAYSTALVFRAFQSRGLDGKGRVADLATSVVGGAGSEHSWQWSGADVIYWSCMMGASVAGWLGGWVQWAQGR